MDSSLKHRVLAGCLSVFFSWLCNAAASGQTLLQLYDINSGAPVRYPSYITEYDGMMYFRGATGTSNSDVELWRSNGIYAERAADIVPGASGGSSPAYLTSYNGKLYFQANGPTGANKLWQYDAVTNQASLAPGSAAGGIVPTDLTVYNGALYFNAARFSSPNIGSELWKFNGTTQACTDMYPGSGSSYPQHFIEYNGLLYFNACGAAGQGTELWRTNGVGAPTNAATIYPNNGSSPENFGIFNNQLYFSAYEGTHGRELWKFDSATNQASLVADILPGNTYDSSNPSNLCVYNGKLYFSATDGVSKHGYELWSYDGVNPPSMVVEINPTPDPGNGDTFLMDSSPGNLKVFNNTLYFSANDGVHGRELWSWDGDQAQMVEDINPGQWGSDPSELTVYDNKLYFSADTGEIPGSAQPKFMALVLPEPVIYIAGGGGRTFSGNVAGAPAVTNDGTLTIASGTNTILSLAGSGRTAVSAGARLVIQGQARQRALTIEPAGSVTLQSGGGPVILDQLGMGNAQSGFGKLDIADRNLVLNYTGASLYADVVQLVLQGQAGTDGITSSLAYQATAYPTMLAVVDNNAIHAVALDGQTISNGLDFNQILIKYTYLGDANLDGVVDPADTLGILAHMGLASASYFDGDLNYDGLVSPADLALVTDHLGAGAGGASGQPLASAWTYADTTTVPEPAALVLAAGLVAILGRHRLPRG